MSAPFNTGDFWIAGAAVAGGPDPNFGYPDSVANMATPPLVLLRLNDASVADNQDAADYMGYGDFWYDNYGSNFASVENMLECDCQNGLFTGPITTQGGVGDGRTVIPLNNTRQFSTVMYVSVADLSNTNVLFHYGSVSSLASLGFVLQMKSDGHLWVYTGGTAYQNVEITEHDFSELDEHVIGVDVDDYDVDIYLDGTLLKSFTLTGDWVPPNPYQRVGWGNGLSWNSVYNAAGWRSSMYLSAALLWDQPIGPTAHAFVAGEMLQDCSPEFDCQWHIDFDADAEILATPGDVQLGDFWIVED